MPFDDEVVENQRMTAEKSIGNAILLFDTVDIARGTLTEFDIEILP
ncbi:hypothetical protein [Haloferax chudinovii]|uniref:Uncharacterized protein n=1 Tax=Haloferax chudinovii TaxID=1109010 RepID=A0ABD5XH19_9EURY